MTSRRRNKFYIKLLIFVSLIGIIPVILLGVFSYIKSADSILDKVEKEKESDVFQTQMMMEQLLKQVDQSLANFSMSQLTKQLLEEPLRPIQFLLYRDLKKELNYLQQFDAGVQDIIYINEEQGWLVRNRGLMRITSSENEYIKKLEKLTNQSTWVIQDVNDIPTDQATNNCKRQLSMVKKLPLSSTENKGYLVALIPSCGFQEKMSTQQNYGTTFILTERNEIVYSDGNKQFLEHTSELKEMVEEQGRTGQFQTQLLNETYTITFRVSDYNGWTYINVIQLSELKGPSYAIGWFTFIACLIIIFILILVAIFITEKLYKPIQLLQKSIKSLNYPPKANKKLDEFNIIEQHISSISKKNRYLEQKSEEQEYQLNQFFVNKLIQGKASKEEIERKIFTYRGCQWFTVLSIQIDSIENSKFQLEDKDILLFSIKTMVEETIKHEKRLTPIVYENKQVTLLIGKEEDKNNYQETIHPIIERLHETIVELLHIPVSIGVSNHHKDMWKANLAFQESDVALKQSFVLGKNKIIYFNKNAVKDAKKNLYPKQIEHELMEAIKSVEEDSVNDKLKEMLAILLNEKQNYTQYEIAIVRFITKLLEVAEMLAIEIKMSYGQQSIFYNLYQFTTKEQLEEWLKINIICPILENLKQRATLQYSSLSERIIHIIQEEYDQEISLENIAQRLDYNTSYLSSLFKSETNMSFSEYLANYKIEVAKNWLETTSMPVREIAEKLQYNNSQNFIRSFRRLTGFTPGKYRKQFHYI